MRLPLPFEEAVTDRLAVKPPPKGRRAKFKVSERVRANEKAPTDYKGREGTGAERGPSRSEYGIRFDGQEEIAYLNSWWLDPA